MFTFSCGESLSIWECSMYLLKMWHSKESERYRFCFPIYLLSQHCINRLTNVNKPPERYRKHLPSAGMLSGFPCGSTGIESTCNVGDLGSVPGLGRSPGKGKATHSSILAWKTPKDCIVHGVAKGRTQLSDSLSLHFRVLMESTWRCPCP